MTQQLSSLTSSAAVIALLLLLLLLLLLQLRALPEQCCCCCCCCCCLAYCVLCVVRTCTAPLLSVLKMSFSQSSRRLQDTYQVPEPKTGQNITYHAAGVGELQTMQGR
jgi:hypothetical protein